MSDHLPRWPAAWLEDHELTDEQVIAEVGDVKLRVAMRSDGQVLLSVVWPEGRRYLIADPVGLMDPRALRAGEESEDTEVVLLVDGLWSRALELAKKLIDGESELEVKPPNGPPA